MDAIHRARTISIPIWLGVSSPQKGFSEEEINYSINLAKNALLAKNSFMDISFNVHDGLRDNYGNYDWIIKTDFKDRLTTSYYGWASKELRLTFGNVYIFIVGKQKIIPGIDFYTRCNYWE